MDHGLKLEYNHEGRRSPPCNLNTVGEYGSNAHGEKSAAQTFFNKGPTSSTCGEAAVLVGVVNAPHAYALSTGGVCGSARGWGCLSDFSSLPEILCLGRFFGLFVSFASF